MKKFDLIQYQSHTYPHYRKFGIIVTDQIEVPYIPDHAGATPGSYDILNPASYDMYHAVIIMDVMTHDLVLMGTSNLIEYKFDFYDSFMFGDHVAPLRTIANCIEKLQETLVKSYHEARK